MAKIENSLPKETTGAYTRIFGNEELGRLITKIQSTVISNETELERMINLILKNRNQLIINVDEFLSQSSNIDNPSGIFVIPKNAIKKSKIINFRGSHEPDFVILKLEASRRHCHIVELKDGYIFDTKKASGEKDALQKFEMYIATKIQFSTSIHLCAFNQINKKEISVGLKGKFSNDEILTGQEFCELLEISYIDIIQKRENDQIQNIDYFINELLKIAPIKYKIIESLKDNLL